jgi:Na+/proline symporter
MQAVLVVALSLLAVLSFAASPRVRTVDGFFRGTGDLGASPGLWTLVLSQVTTWIFARSLLNAAILGYLYGIAGTLAYAAYYGSFLTGAWIIDAIRFRHGHGSVQSYMKSAFGPSAR